MNEPKLLTIPEVAQRLGVHRVTVYRLIRAGVLPTERVRVAWNGATAQRVAAADVERLASERASAEAR